MAKGKTKTADYLRKNALGLPVFVYLTALVGGALVYIVILSFLTRGQDGGVLPTFTFDNYRRVADSVIIGIFLDTLCMAALTSFFTLMIGAPFAFCITKLAEKWRMRALFLLMLVFFTSSLIRINGWMLILQTNGVLSRMLQFLGMADEPVQYMFNLPSIIAVNTYMFLPFMILPVYNAAEKIDPVLYEAAHDLGAGRVRRFLSVTMPLCKFGILGGIMLTFIPLTGMYFIADTIGGGRFTLGRLIHNQMLGQGNSHPFGAALSVALLLILAAPLLLYMLTKRRVRKAAP